MYAVCAMPFVDFRMLLFFSITFYSAEIAYFNLPNRELSNGVRVMEQDIEIESSIPLGAHA